MNKQLSEQYLYINQFELYSYEDCTIWDKFWALNFRSLLISLEGDF